MAHPHHPDGLVVAPKHIVTDHNRIHSRLDAIRRIARPTFRQFTRDEVVFDIVGGFAVRHATYRLKTDGGGSTLETIGGDMVAVAFVAIGHIGNLDVDLSLIKDIM